MSVVSWTCTVCMQSKPLTSEHFDSDIVDGCPQYRKQCKPCIASLRELCGQLSSGVRGASQTAAPTQSSSPRLDIKSHQDRPHSVSSKSSESTPERTDLPVRASSSKAAMDFTAPGGSSMRSVNSMQEWLHAAASAPAPRLEQPAAVPVSAPASISEPCKLVSNACMDHAPLAPPPHAECWSAPLPIVVTRIASSSQPNRASTGIEGSELPHHSPAAQVNASGDPASRSLFPDERLLTQTHDSAAKHALDVPTDPPSRDQPGDGSDVSCSSLYAAALGHNGGTSSGARDANPAYRGTSPPLEGDARARDDEARVSAVARLQDDRIAALSMTGLVANALSVRPHAALPAPVAEGKGVVTDIARLLQSTAPSSPPVSAPHPELTKAIAAMMFGANNNAVGGPSAASFAGASAPLPRNAWPFGSGMEGSGAHGVSNAPARGDEVVSQLVRSAVAAANGGSLRDLPTVLEALQAYVQLPPQRKNITHSAAAHAEPAADTLQHQLLRPYEQSVLAAHSAPLPFRPSLAMPSVTTARPAPAFRAPGAAAFAAPAAPSIATWLRGNAWPLAGHDAAAGLCFVAADPAFAMHAPTSAQPALKRPREGPDDAFTPNKQQIIDLVRSIAHAIEPRAPPQRERADGGAAAGAAADAAPPGRAPWTAASNAAWAALRPEDLGAPGAARLQQGSAAPLPVRESSLESMAVEQLLMLKTGEGASAHEPQPSVPLAASACGIINTSSAPSQPLPTISQILNLAVACGQGTSHQPPAMRHAAAGQAAAQPSSMTLAWPTACLTHDEHAAPPAARPTPYDSRPARIDPHTIDGELQALISAPPMSWKPSPPHPPPSRPEPSTLLRWTSWARSRAEGDAKTTQHTANTPASEEEVAPRPKLRSCTACFEVKEVSLFRHKMTQQNPPRKAPHSICRSCECRVSTISRREGVSWKEALALARQRAEKGEL